jgi:hypothetical protein
MRAKVHTSLLSDLLCLATYLQPIFALLLSNLVIFQIMLKHPPSAQRCQSHACELQVPPDVLRGFSTLIPKGRPAALQGPTGPTPWALCIAPPPEQFTCSPEEDLRPASPGTQVSFWVGGRTVCPSLPWAWGVGINVSFLGQTAKKGSYLLWPESILNCDLFILLSRPASDLDWPWLEAPCLLFTF